MPAPLYTLERTLPNGTVKVTPMAMTAREAGISAAYVLYDNGAASKSDAQRVSRPVERSKGEYVEAHGYRFRLLPAAGPAALSA